MFCRSLVVCTSASVSHLFICSRRASRPAHPQPTLLRHHSSPNGMLVCSRASSTVISFVFGTFACLPFTLNVWVAEMKADSHFSRDLFPCGFTLPLARFCLMWYQYNDDLVLFAHSHLHSCTRTRANALMYRAQKMLKNMPAQQLAQQLHVVWTLHKTEKVRISACGCDYSITCSFSTTFCVFAISCSFVQEQ